MGILSIKSQFSRPAPSSILAITRTIRGRKLRDSIRPIFQANFLPLASWQSEISIDIKIYSETRRRGGSRLFSLRNELRSRVIDTFVKENRDPFVPPSSGTIKFLYSSLKLPVPGYPPLSRYTLVTYTRTCTYEYAGESRRIGKKEERKGKDERGETRKSVFVENAIKDDGWTRMEWQRSEGEGRET